MSAVIISPPASKILTTLENVATYLGIALGTAGDRQLEMLIAQASASVATFCGREFGVATYREVIRCSRSQDEIVLSAGPIISVSSVSMNGVAVLVDQYEVEGSNLYSVSGSGNRRPWYRGAVTIEYVAGWVLPDQDTTGLPALAQDLPADIERAVMQLVGAARSQSGRGDPMLKTVEVEGIGRREYYVQGSRASLPHPEAEATLERYRSMVLV